MRDKPTIRFEIPLPWAERPASIQASGPLAVLIAALSAILIFLILAG